MAASEREERGGAISYRVAERFPFGDTNKVERDAKNCLFCTADIPIEVQKVIFLANQR